MATLNDISTWAVHTRGGLREFFTKEGTHWVEQNRAKKQSVGEAAREGHDIAGEFENRERGGYTGRILIDGEPMTAKDAYKRFFRGIPNELPLDQVVAHRIVNSQGGP